jgi:hypothetical protein
MGTVSDFRFLNGEFVMIAQPTNKRLGVFTSPNGFEWKEKSNLLAIPQISQDITSSIKIEYANGVYCIATAQQNVPVAYSYNLSDWYQTKLAFRGINLQDVVTHNGKFYFQASNPPTTVYTEDAPEGIGIPNKIEENGFVEYMRIK